MVFSKDDNPYLYIAQDANNNHTIRVPLICSSTDASLVGDALWASRSTISRVLPAGVNAWQALKNPGGTMWGSSSDPGLQMFGLLTEALTISRSGNLLHAEPVFLSHQQRTIRLTFGVNGKRRTVESGDWHYLHGVLDYFVPPWDLDLREGFMSIRHRWESPQQHYAQYSADVVGNNVLRALDRAIPGLGGMVLESGCPGSGHVPTTNGLRPLTRVITCLNDRHEWSREQIADWLETLDLDLSFKTPEEVNK